MKCPIHKCDGEMTECREGATTKTYQCPKCSTAMIIPKGLKTSPDSNDKQGKQPNKGD